MNRLAQSQFRLVFPIFLVGLTTAAVLIALYPRFVVAQEFTPIVDALQCARFSNGSQLLVRQEGEGFDFVDPKAELDTYKRERRKLTARRKLFQSRLNNLSQASRARKRLLGATINTFGKLFGDADISVLRNLGPSEAETAVQILIDRIDLRLAELSSVEGLIQGCLQGKNPRLGGGSFLSASVRPLVGIVGNRVIGGYVVTTNGIGTKFRKKPGAFYGCLMFRDKYGELLVPLKIFDTTGVCGGLGELSLPTSECDALLSGGTMVGTSIPILNYDNDGRSAADRLNSAYLELAASQPEIGVIASKESLSAFEHSSFCEKYR